MASLLAGMGMLRGLRDCNAGARSRSGLRQFRERCMRSGIRYLKGQTKVLQKDGTMTNDQNKNQGSQQDQQKSGQQTGQQQRQGGQQGGQQGQDNQDDDNQYKRPGQSDQEANKDGQQDKR